MKKTNSQAIYLDDGVDSSKRLSTVRRPLFRAFITSIVAIIFAGFFAPIVFGNISGNSENSVANAGPMAVFCKGLGQGMGSQSPWKATLSSYPNFDASGREWTGQEAFSGNMQYVVYYGEGKSDTWGISDAPDDRAKDYGNSSDVKDKIESPRGYGNCVVGVGVTYVANLVFTGSSSLAALMSAISTYAFDADFVCSDPQNPEGNCFNLAGIIGGEGNNDSGLIGALTSSIYLPLLVIVATLAAFWVLYEGIVKKRIRSAFIGALWVIVAVVLGVASLFNSQILAKAPMTAASSVSACIIGAFNGTNCFTSSGSSDSDSDIMESKDICVSDANGLSLTEQTSMAVNGLNCSIWKAFVLEPYAQASFGMGFEDLDTRDGAISDAVEESGIDSDVFCVNRKSSESGESMENDTLSLDSGPQVCNLAIYQMYLKGDIHSSDDEGLSDNGAQQLEDGVDKRWYNVVVVAANDDKVWSRWNGSPSSALYKTMLSFFAGFTTLLGGAIILVTAFLAMIYYIVSVMLMALAPLFFLAAIHPGKGRSIFLGWLEIVVENIFKYLVSALFLIITIAFYGAVLGNVDNIGASMIFVLILTGALFLHRAELMNLIGKVNMGGQRMSSAFADRVKSLGESASRSGAGALGGMAAVGARGNFSDYMKSGSAGATDSIKRDLKRQHKGFGGFVGAAARQAERSSNDNRRDLKHRADRASSEASNTGQDFESKDQQYQEAASGFEQTQNQMQRDRVDLDDLNARVEVRNESEDKVLLGMESDNQGFADMQHLSNELRDVSAQHRSAVASGDVETATDLAAKKDVLVEQVGEANKSLTTQDRSRGERRYQRLLGKELDEAGISYTSEDEKRHAQVSERYAEAASTYEEERARVNNLADERDEAERAATHDKTRADTISDEYVDWQPGQTLTKSKVNKVDKKVEQQAQDAMPDNHSRKFDDSIEDFEQQARNNAGIQDQPRPNFDPKPDPDDNPPPPDDEPPPPDDGPPPPDPDDDGDDDDTPKPTPSYSLPKNGGLSPAQEPKPSDVTNTSSFANQSNFTGSESLPPVRGQSRPTENSDKSESQSNDKLKDETANNNVNLNNTNDVSNDTSTSENLPKPKESQPPMKPTNNISEEIKRDKNQEKPSEPRKQDHNTNASPFAPKKSEPANKAPEKIPKPEPKKPTNPTPKPEKMMTDTSKEKSFAPKKQDKETNTSPFASKKEKPKAQETSSAPSKVNPPPKDLPKPKQENVPPKPPKTSPEPKQSPVPKPEKTNKPSKTNSPLSDMKLRNPLKGKEPTTYKRTSSDGKFDNKVDSMKQQAQKMRKDEDPFEKK